MSRCRINKITAFDVIIDEIATDKSISHRCGIFSLLSDKPSKIKNFLKAEDTLNTLGICEALGAKIHFEGDELTITPPSEIREPDDILYCGNSGTTIRLFSGFLSSLDGFFVLTGDQYLRKRPMKRVADPLRSIGAKIDGRMAGDLAPLAIRGGTLKAFEYRSKIASAQVKSAMILAALRGDGVSRFSEPELSRDHSEKMLTGMGASLEVDDGIVIQPLNTPLKPLEMKVPSDPSSAFFFAVAAAILPGSKVVIKNILLNKTRIGAFKVLEKMGVKIDYQEIVSLYESMGDVTLVSPEKLQAVEVSENISWLIDELPALAIAMSVAEGKSTVRNAKELRVKESDRISATVSNLQRCGIEASELEDGFEIVGGTLKEGKIVSFGDHRIAMSFAIAGLVASMEIDDTECIQTSFPNFFDILKKIGAEVQLEA